MLAPSRIEARQARNSAWWRLIAFCVMFCALSWSLWQFRSIFALGHALKTHRDLASAVVLFGLTFDWLLLGVTALLLRANGLRLVDLGLLAKSPASGWIAAAVVATAYLAIVIAGPLRGVNMLSDWSAFRVNTALGIALTAGFCEETVFRGFVMSQARSAGAPMSIQVLLSSLLFGLAHAGWGLFGTHTNLRAAISAMIATSVLGAMLSAVYLLGHRSLLPAIAAHAATDLVIEPWLILAATQGPLG